MSVNNELVAEVLQKGLDDWVYLDEVAYAVRIHDKLDDPIQIKKLTIELVEYLLINDYVSVGELVGSGTAMHFQPWELDKISTVKEIEKLWSEFDGPRAKDCGSDVCWIMNTPRGNELAKLQEESMPNP